MLRNAAFAASVVASMPIVFFFDQAGRTDTLHDPRKHARCVSSAISRRVREIVEWSGVEGMTRSRRQIRRRDSHRRLPIAFAVPIDMRAV